MCSAKSEALRKFEFEINLTMMDLWTQIMAYYCTLETLEIHSRSTKFGVQVLQRS